MQESKNTLEFVKTGEPEYGSSDEAQICPSNAANSFPISHPTTWPHIPIESWSRAGDKSTSMTMIAPHSKWKDIFPLYFSNWKEP